MARRRFSRITERDFKRAAKRLDRLNTKLVKQRVPSGLRLVGDEIMLDIKASRPGKGVPVDKGILRSTGRVEGPNPDVELSFGGQAAPYALKQHEDTSLRHDIGEARFLVRGAERWEQNGASVQRALNELRKAVDEVVLSR